MRLNHIVISALLFTSVNALAEPKTKPQERILGLCKGVPASLAIQGIPYNVGPLGSAANYFRLYSKEKIEIPSTTKVGVIEAPKHGKFVITPAQNSEGYARYDYINDIDYLGDDSVTLKVELAEKPVTLVYIFHIQNVGDDESDRLCDKTGRHWKIALTLHSSGTPIGAP